MSLTTVDIGDLTRITGTFTAVVGSPVSISGVRVKIARRDPVTGQPGSLTTLTAIQQSGSWAVDWTPNLSGVWFVRAEALANSVVVSAVDGLIKVRNSPLA